MGFFRRQLLHELGIRLGQLIQVALQSVEKSKKLSGRVNILSKVSRQVLCRMIARNCLNQSEGTLSAEIYRFFKNSGTDRLTGASIG